MTAFTYACVDVCGLHYLIGVFQCRSFCLISFICPFNNHAFFCVHFIRLKTDANISVCTNNNGFRQDLALVNYDFFFFFYWTKFNRTNRLVLATNKKSISFFFCTSKCQTISIGCSFHSCKFHLNARLGRKCCVATAAAALITINNNDFEHKLCNAESFVKPKTTISINTHQRFSQTTKQRAYTDESRKKRRPNRKHFFFTAVTAAAFCSSRPWQADSGRRCYIIIKLNRHMCHLC